MSPRCPKPCGRLATAGVFVSIGVIQFIAGLILLKSKYVYLLAAPNMWTAVSNFSVGCLLGISAGVWRNTRKRTFKHTTRRNILAALVGSVVLMNSTTAIILILGEGNTLLSIRLERDGRNSSTALASDILAYSYATSVCCPIVCIVVALTFLSGIWFRVRDKEEKMPEIRSILKKDSINEYNWVFKRKNLQQSDTQVKKHLSFKSLSSTDDESCSSTDSQFRCNSVPAVDFLNTPLRKAIYKVGSPRKSKVFRKHLWDCGEHLENGHGSTSHETSVVSCAVHSGRSTESVKQLPFTSKKQIRHFRIDDQLDPGRFEYVDDDSLTYRRFKEYKHSGNLKLHSKRTRPLLMDHPVFRIAEMSNGEENARILQNYTPETHYLSSKIQPSLSSKSEIEADVYTNSTYLSNPDLSYQEMAMEEKAYICENAPSNEVIEQTTGKENANIQKSLSYKSFSDPYVSELIDGKKHGSRLKKICRTSTTAIRNSPRVSQLDISDIEYDTVASRNDEIADITSDRPVLSPKPSISRMYSNFEVDDTFFEPSVSKSLAGEVVAVKVNTLPRKHHPSKLIPVPIPVVSNFKNSQKKMQNKRKNTLTTVEIPQIEDDDSAREERGKFVRKKVMFSSFRGNIRTKTISNGSSDDEYLKHTNEQCEANTSEAFTGGSIPPSPAHTSGYDSAFDENTQISYSEGFKPNSSSTIRAHSSYSTPQKVYSTPRHLRNMQNISNPEADNPKAFVGRTSSDVRGGNANKELISQLLNDVSFQKMTQKLHSEEKM